MNTEIYQPFKNFDFKYKRCFLSGASDPAELIEVPVLPGWLLEAANFSGEEQIKLLDESIRSYKTLTVPCSKALNDHEFQALEDKISQAFLSGYEAVSRLEEVELFHWIGKFMYGLIYIEMNAAVRQQQLTEDGLNMSQGLMHKFGNLHTMLQGIFRSVVFEDFSPWSIVVVRLEDQDTAFSFRDEINTLTFSMKLNDFGIIACLQDNGTNKKYHQELLSHLGERPAQAQQFEELCARFYYSAYLFNRLPEYALLPVEGSIYVDAMPLKGTLNKPIFDYWQHKTYAQVLQEFWKPWGHTLFEIIKDPARPISYFDEPHLPETQ